MIASITAYLCANVQPLDPLRAFRQLFGGRGGRRYGVGRRRSRGHHTAQSTGYRGARGAGGAPDRGPVDAAGDGRRAQLEPLPRRGAMRLIESRLREGRRTHHLVVVADDAPLQCALEAAAGGRSVEKVVDAVVAQAASRRDEAREYVDALVEAKVLTPVAEPAVTGPEPLTHVLSALNGLDLAATTEALPRVAERAHRSGRRRDRESATALGHPSGQPARAGRGGGGDEARLIQVDLHREERV